MIAPLILAVAVTFTPPTNHAAPISNAEGVVIGYSCSDTTRAIMDTLRAELVGRRQATVWRVFQSIWAAGDSTAEAWQSYWPIIKADADARWVREKVVRPGVRDTMAVPGRCTFVGVRCRVRGAFGCFAEIGLP